ncbi:MAG: hypothetical protein MJY85_03190 [Fibrobacter sp.]|nr:hypothetical protein [Fibrobacter sp.]
MNGITITQRLRFAKSYGTPIAITSEDCAASKMDQMKKIIERNNIYDLQVLEFCTLKIRQIREQFTSLRNKANDMLQFIVARKPANARILYSNVTEGQRFTSEWWEREASRKFEVLNPKLFQGQTCSKKRTQKSLIQQAMRPDLRCDIPIVLISGSNFDIEALENSCGFKIARHIPVERNEKATKKLQALWNTTHMLEFGIIVCLCKHISHTATQTIERNIKGSSDWEMINSFNDNVQMISEKIKDAIARHEREK